MDSNKKISNEQLTEMIGDFRNELKSDIVELRNDVQEHKEGALKRDEKEEVLSAARYVNKQLVRDALGTQETDEEGNELSGINLTRPEYD